MTVEYALRLARQWSQGHICTLREGEAKEYHKLVASLLEKELSQNDPLTLEEVAKEYLEICGGDYSGDNSVGIPSCPFFQMLDVDENGAQIVSRCKLAVYRRLPEGEDK